jgi:hypothetical protein
MSQATSADSRPSPLPRDSPQQLNPLPPTPHPGDDNPNLVPQIAGRQFYHLDTPLGKQNSVCAISAVNSRRLT